MKIVYTVNNGSISWVNKLVDETKYVLQANEMFGDLHKKPFPQGDNVIETWTQADQDIVDAAIAQRTLDSDVSANKVRKRLLNGQLAYNRFWNKIERKFNGGIFTTPQLVELDEIYEALSPLKEGRWQISIFRLNKIAPPLNIKLKNSLEEIKQKINDYITNNY